jgi:hypothetical protein
LQRVLSYRFPDRTASSIDSRRAALCPMAERAIRRRCSRGIQMRIGSHTLPARPTGSHAQRRRTIRQVSQTCLTSIVTSQTFTGNGVSAMDGESLWASGVGRRTSIGQATPDCRVRQIKRKTSPSVSRQISLQGRDQVSLRRTLP